MQIQSTHTNIQTKKPQAQAPTPKSEETSAFNVSDAVEFGTDFAKGAVPLYGSYKNLEASLTAGIFGADTKSNIAGLGMLANLAGTVSLGAGLATGNNSACLAGAGLLLASGVTNATSYL